MKIYDFKGFPNPARVRIALAEKGLADQVEFVHVDVPAGEHKQPEFLKKNPSGAVPVLELADGTVISECSAITEYLDHLTGEADLTGRTAKERGVIAMMQRKIEAGLLDAVATYFHQATEGLGPEIETYQNKAWGERQRDVAVKTMSWLDGELSNRDYVAGDRVLGGRHHHDGGTCFCRFRKDRHSRDPATISRRGVIEFRHVRV